MHFDCARALAQGLRIRPLAETIDATAAWLGARNDAGAWRNVLSAEVERTLLRCARARERRSGCDARDRRARRRAIMEGGPRSARAATPMDNAARTDEFLEFARRMAQAAGAAILPHFRVALDVEDKGGARGLRPRHRRRSRGRSR